MIGIEYKWMIGRKDGCLVFTDWNGTSEECLPYNPRLMGVDRDEEGVPVVRVIGCQKVGVHFRIERPEPDPDDLPALSDATAKIIADLQGE